jgi:SAM-dependent methyltransferase
VPARRLALLAEVFGATSREFVLRDGLPAPALALDLGCGPGHTTRLLAGALHPARTLGLDASADYIARAAGSAPEGVAFAVQDVVADPLPGPAPDLVYARFRHARFLVTHLARPEATVARWAAQLATGGRLLLEDTEAMETEDATFGEYIARVEERLAERGHRLIAGPVLASVATRSRLAIVAPPAGLAAAMFRLNLDSWCEDGAVRDRLGAALERLFGDQRTGVITWRVRQAVVERSTH